MNPLLNSNGCGDISNTCAKSLRTESDLHLGQWEDRYFKVEIKDLGFACTSKPVGFLAFRG